ncbi:hypothetical protein GCM10010222_16180 [Streptomyces tanashiensis]|nr:hypothetical protein GCM10010222_16180 [Streptomyces tanashiensis]
MEFVRLARGVGGGDRDGADVAADPVGGGLDVVVREGVHQMLLKGPEPGGRIDDLPSPSPPSPRNPVDQGFRRER